MGQVNQNLQKVIDMGIEFAPKLIGALLVVILGFWITTRLVGVLRKKMRKTNMDASLQPFLLSMLSVLFKVMIVFSAAGIVGIQTASFVAVLGAAGLAIGLALQGSLSNFASGVLILMFRPYKVGDFIATQGFSGTVREIQIFTTVMTTVDNRMIIVPNASILSGPIENFSALPERQLDLVVGISYGDDIDLARQIIAEIIQTIPGQIPDKEIRIFVKKLSESSVDLGVRFWVESTEFWNATFLFQEKVKKAFDNESVGIPFPQLDVRIHQ